MTAAWPPAPPPRNTKLRHKDGRTGVLLRAFKPQPGQPQRVSVAVDNATGHDVFATWTMDQCEVFK